MKKLFNIFVVFNSIIMILIFIRMGVFALVSRNIVNNSVAISLISDVSVIPNFKSFDGEAGLEERYNNLLYNINGFENLIDDFCTSSFPGINTINPIKESYDDLLHYRSAYIDPKEIQPLVQKVVAFQQWLSEEDCAFLCVHAPSQSTLNGINQKKISNAEYKTYQRNLIYTQQLKEYVPFINMSDYLGDKEYDYDVSGHWSPKSALLSLQFVSDYLNKNGIRVDSEIFRPEKYVNYMEQQSAEATYINNTYGYNLDIPIPKEDNGKYYLEINGECISKGDFQSTFINQENSLGHKDGAYHWYYSLGNNGYSSIVNENQSQGRILVIGDSFAWPVYILLNLFTRLISYIVLIIMGALKSIFKQISWMQ